MFFQNVFCISIDKLVLSALENNLDILTAEKNYNLAETSCITLNGAYVPQITYSASSNLSESYELNTPPDYFSTGITYKQPLPGGTTFGIKGVFSFNTTEVYEERYILQSSDICFSLTQSLLPYWLQGQIHNPIKLNTTQQKDYYYYQLLYAKKNVLQNLFLNYIYASVYKNQIEIYENSIKLIDEQIRTTEQMLSSGESSQIQITQLQNSKWNYQQDYMNCKANFYDYVQNVKNLCGIDFDDEDFFISEITKKELLLLIDQILDKKEDPLEFCYKLKIELIKSAHILERQNSAPFMELSLQPSWKLEAQKIDNWKEAWKNIESPKTWAVSIGINLSPLFSGVAEQNKKKFEMDLQQAEHIYSSYIAQKNIVILKYIYLKEQYESRLKEITKLYEDGLSELIDFEKQYASGSISKFDLETMQVRVNTCGNNLKIIELYCFLYDLLIILNK